MSQNTHYELTLITDANIPENEYKGKLEEIKKIIEKNQGNIDSEIDLGRKKLSYPIKKMLKGNFYSLEIDIEPKALKPIEKKLKLNKNILRYILIKKSANIKQVIKKSDSEKKETLKQKPQKIEIDKKTEDIKLKTEDVKDIKTEPEDKKADLDELDKKLNEILSDEIID